MSTLYYGSICLTDMIEKAKEKHSAFTKANNGKIYTNVRIWVNDEPDQFGNSVSVQLSSSKEKVDTEKKMYIGNAKKAEVQQPAPLNNTDISKIDDDLSF